MVKHSTISIRNTTWHWVWVLVNTLVHSTLVVIPEPCFWHEVAGVLQSPCWWTPGFSWNHGDCHPCWSIAYSTGYIVIVNSWEWCSCECLILCSIHVAVSLDSRLVAEIVWIIRHAEVVGCSSLMCIPCSTNPPCIHQCGTWDTWTATFPPPCVDHSTTSRSRGTCYSLVSSSVLVGPRGPGTPSRPSLPSRPRSTSM